MPMKTAEPKKRAPRKRASKAAKAPVERIPKGEPITYRLDSSSDEIMREMSEKTGLSVSELSRRSWEVFLREVVKRKGMMGWILDEGVSGTAAAEYRKL